MAQQQSAASTIEAGAAIVLAAGADDASRALLARPLGDSTVVELAVQIGRASCRERVF